MILVRRGPGRIESGQSRDELGRVSQPLFNLRDRRVHRAQLSVHKRRGARRGLNRAIGAIATIGMQRGQLGLVSECARKFETEVHLVGGRQAVEMRELLRTAVRPMSDESIPGTKNRS